METSGGGRLKQRLARMFRASSLLRSTCSSSSTASILGSTATSSRSLSSDLAHEPVFVPRRADADLVRSLLPGDHRGRYSVFRPSRQSPQTCVPNKKKKKMKKKKLLSNAYGFTSSSSEDDSDGEFGLILSSGGEEKGKYLSSRSFSSDSSEFYRRPFRKTAKKSKNMSSSRRRPARREEWMNSSAGHEPMVSRKRREEEGLAVVKRSRDPYADFRSSMVEMIVERQVFGEEQLEGLLGKYLSLNSPDHHRVIIKAFSDIWEVLFSH